MKPRRRAFDSAPGSAPGGGDVRLMRKVGGYSTVGFRANPPIDREPPIDAEAAATERELAAIDRELAAIDRELAAADRELAATASDARLAGVPEARARLAAAHR
ncbi:hypothetical protein [Nocardia blacklockiae]|uniref:hypothetical protein n=1 Tax=Nocardia blacklockiae TaxID=480036 RepID=UPI0018954AE3|nr:hypothetical protein [Nocardia blacklockiae]MBF6170358.1 hypothetical protein [Nocardia blacklockiae]